MGHFDDPQAKVLLIEERMLWFPAYRLLIGLSEYTVVVFAKSDVRGFEDGLTNRMTSVSRDVERDGVRDVLGG
jgi:hypothetical protein